MPDAGRGGLAKQDARLMQLLEVIRHEANDLLIERRDDRRRDAEIKKWRHERAEALR